jgi:uncharacterized protein (TIGR02246 family)
MSHWTNVASCIGLTVTLVGIALPASGQANDEAAINRRVDGLYQSIAKRDVEGYMAALQKDAVRAIGTNVAVGRSAIEPAVTAALAAAGTPIKFTRHSTRLLSPTTAIVHGVTADPSTNRQTGHAIFTLVKEGNDWLIAAFQTASPTP